MFMQTGPQNVVVLERLWR